MFPFTVVPAYNLPVYASQRPLPDATQDSVRGCSLGFAAAVIADGRLQRACKAQPAQIPACAANAPGSSLGSNVGGAHGLKPHALRRTAANRIDVAARLSVRTTAACRLFPSGEALPSTTSAGSCLPLFGRFLGTTTSSDFSPAYMLGVRLLPSRVGPAHVRARMRPPRFRAKNRHPGTRSPTAQGSSHASQYAMGRCCLLFNGSRSAPRN